ncbi:hypothetical protein V6N13_106993 [Hibiscus sabdariffa]
MGCEKGAEVEDVADLHGEDIQKSTVVSKETTVRVVKAWPPPSGVIGDRFFPILEGHSFSGEEDGRHKVDEDPFSRSDLENNVENIEAQAIRDGLFEVLVISADNSMNSWAAKEVRPNIDNGSVVG